MRPEHHCNTHPRLLRKTALGDTVAATPTRGSNSSTGKEPKSLGGPPNTQAGPEDRTLVRRTGKAAHRAARPAHDPNATGLVSDTDAEVPRTPVEEDSSHGDRGSAKKGRSRFVGPTHLGDTTKDRILKALERRGIGDQIGREIFVGALEYQLSALGGQLQRRGEARPSAAAEPQPRPEPPPRALPDETLRAISEQTRRLADQLRALSEPARAEVTLMIAALDRLGRGYDEHYLREFACEIERLEQACACMIELVPDSEPTADPTEPAEDPSSSRALVARLASVFSECFEQEPTSAENGWFRSLLAVLDEETGYVIRQDPEFLEEVLDGA